MNGNRALDIKFSYDMTEYVHGILYLLIFNSGIKFISLTLFFMLHELNESNGLPTSRIPCWANDPI